MHVSSVSSYASATMRFSDNLAKEEILQDDRFFFIAGYTSGGAPYGVTWEKMGLKPWEDLEENN